MLHQKITLLSFICFLLPLFSFVNVEAKNDQADARLHIIGLSLLTPPGENWTYNIVHPGRIEFGKLGSSKYESFAASAYIHKIPITASESEFLKKISEIRWQDRDNQTRYRNLKTEEIITYEKEDICVRYHTKFEDHGSKYLSKNIPFFIIEDIGLICRYPGKENIGISIGISQRVKPSQIMNNFETIANIFLANAKFDLLSEDTNN